MLEKLINHKKINIILGKNGSGKSSLLRHLNKNLDKDYKTQYISPERGGLFTYDVNVMHNLSNNKKYIDDSRNQNQVQQFKQQSHYRLTTLLTDAAFSFLEEVSEKSEKKSEFKRVHPNVYIEKINKLLGGNLVLTLDNRDHRFTANRALDSISSGEAEIISITVESLLYFFEAKDFTESKDSKQYILLLDEPDVHLHPDLQHKFIEFLVEEIKDQQNVKIFISTHSTSILSALSEYPDATVALLKKGQIKVVKHKGKQEPDVEIEKNIEFKEITEELKKLLPVFGAHPLTSIYTENPLLLLEGDNDEIVWQQAIKSSGGKIKFHLVQCNGKYKMKDYIKHVDEQCSFVLFLPHFVYFLLKVVEYLPEYLAGYNIDAE